MGTSAQSVLLAQGGRDCRVLFSTATIVAWDLGALCRILPIEARSP
jgi:hypothetical protein